jgi:hypothetical protein
MPEYILTDGGMATDLSDGQDSNALEWIISSFDPASNVSSESNGQREKHCGSKNWTEAGM